MFWISSPATRLGGGDSLPPGRAAPTSPTKLTDNAETVLLNVGIRDYITSQHLWTARREAWL
jgi:hypothetical protein